MFADRPEEHPRELAVAAAADDEHVSANGALHQDRRRVTFQDAPTYDQILMLFLYFRDDLLEERFGL
jgi:hypothetical protein